MAKKLSQTVKGYEGTLDADDARHVVGQRKGYEPLRTALQDPWSKPPAVLFHGGARPTIDVVPRTSSLPDDQIRLRQSTGGYAPGKISLLRLWAMRAIPARAASAGIMVNMKSRCAGPKSSACRIFAIQTVSVTDPPTALKQLENRQSARSVQ